MEKVHLFKVSLEYFYNLITKNILVDYSSYNSISGPRFWLCCRYSVLRSDPCDDGYCRYKILTESLR